MSVAADRPGDGRTGADGADPFLLKVYEGPHRGAEMPLQSGRRYLVGRGDDADIVLHDPLLEAVHVHLEIERGVVTLLPVGEVSLDGRPLPPGPPSVDPSSAGEGSAGKGAAAVRPTVLEGGVLVGIGGTLFAVARRGRLPAPIKAAAALMARMNASELPDRAFTGPSVQDRPARAGWGKVPYLVSAFVTFAAFVGIVFSQSPKALQPEGGTLAARVGAAVDGLPIRAREVIELPNGKVLLNGHVGSDDELRRIDERLEPFESRVTLQVWSDQGLVDAANQVLSSLGLAQHLSAVSSDGGTVVFKGDVTTKSVWDQALSALREDLAGIESVDDAGVKTVLERVRQVRTALDESFPDADLSVAEAGGEILVRGTVADADVAGLRRLIERLGSEFGGYPALAMQVARVKELPEVPKLPPESQAELDIRWVRTGENGYVLTGDGDRYMQGGRLADGHVIKAIRADRLVLSKDGLDTDYFL